MQVFQNSWNIKFFVINRDDEADVWWSGIIHNDRKRRRIIGSSKPKSFILKKLTLKIFVEILLNNVNMNAQLGGKHLFYKE